MEAGLPELAREIERQKPREAEFYIVLGDAWQSTGEHRKAVAAYEQAVRLSPRSVRALRALAGALQDSGESARASEILKRAMQIAPSDPESWYRYGMLDSSSGRTAEAIEKIQKAIALDPSLPEKSRSLAEILVKAGQPDRAQAALRDALRIDPYDDDAWDLAGRLLAEKGKYPKRCTISKERFACVPAPDRIFTIMRWRSPAPIDSMRRRNAPEPRYAPMAILRKPMNCWEGFSRKRQLPEAAREYRRALELRPDLSRAHLRLGNVLAAQGDISGAQGASAPSRQRER